MDKLNILFLERKGWGLVGAPSNFHGFEEAVGEIANCKWAGKGWELHKEGETVDETVRRVMPDADWVIVDKNTLPSIKKDRRYRVGCMISDLHGKHSHDVHTAVGFCDLLNKCNYDAVFSKYMEIHGTGLDPKIFQNRVKAPLFHLPWSIDPSRFERGRKDIDVTFIGAVSGIYPLRRSVWDDIYYVTRGYKVVREQSPKGKTFERKYGCGTYTGDAYCDLLARSKIMIFGSSIYRYPVQKYFESPACACITVANEPSTAKQLGFVDGKTYVDVNEYDWRDTLQWCLENYDSLKTMARAGMKNIMLNHTHRNRAEDFLEMLE